MPGSCAKMQNISEPYSRILTARKARKLSSLLLRIKPSPLFKGISLRGGKSKGDGKRQMK
jgi:hypothetical protein